MTWTPLILKLCLIAFLPLIIGLSIALTSGQQVESWILSYASRHQSAPEWTISRMDVRRGVSYGLLSTFVAPQTINFSPDGQYVLWMTNMGGATLLDIQTGETQSIDSSLQPRWSPDGQHLLYIGSGGIFTAPIGERGRLVTFSNTMFDPRWSSTGRYLTILERKSDVLTAYVMDAYAGAILYPINAELGSVGPMAWSPDGTQLAFTALQNPGVSLYLVTIATDTDLSMLAPRQVSTPTGYSGNFSWSPDGTHLALIVQETDESVIYLLDIERDSFARVTATQETIVEVQWSPNQTYLALRTTASRVNGRSGNNLLIANLIAPQPAPTQVFSSFIGQLVWSSDGTQLTVVSSLDNSLYLVDADDGESRRLSDANDDVWIVP